MASARYQLFTRFPRAVEWRLISANNRELGRCTEPFLDLSSCTMAVERLREGRPSGDVARVRASWERRWAIMAGWRRPT